jgi:glycosyltransferase involved in cell wall biosynthesis
MPVYNGEAYLGEAVESILGQTYPELELVVVDDCSEDGSGAILDRYDDERMVRARNPERLGIAGSRNRGAELARGEFIAVMDQDDVSLPERLATEVRFLDEHRELDAVGTWVTLIDRTGAPLGEWRHPCEPEEVRRSLADRGCIANGSALIRTEALRRVGGYRPIPVVDDYDLWLRLTDQRACVANIPEFLFRYRIHERQTIKENAQAAAVWAFVCRFGAQRRRQGRPDPLAQLDFDRSDSQLDAILAGRGRLGRAWRAAESWARACGRWDAGDHLGALWPVLQVLVHCPTYPPLRARIGETMARKWRRIRRNRGAGPAS